MNTYSSSKNISSKADKRTEIYNTIYNIHPQ